jgi:hypothetical protein
MLGRMLTRNAIVQNGTLVMDGRIDLPDQTPVVVSIATVKWSDQLKLGLARIRARPKTQLIRRDGARYSRDELNGRH